MGTRFIALGNYARLFADENARMALRKNLGFAALDSAGPWRQFRHITLPLLRNTTVFVLVTTTIQALQLFTQVQILAASGASAPLNAFRTVVMLLVHEGFQRGRIGYASALSVVFFLIVLAITGLQRLLVREREGGP